MPIDALIAAAIAAPVIAIPPSHGLGHRAAVFEDRWPECQRWSDEHGCPVLYLNVVTRHAEAVLSVGESCVAVRYHEWGRADARQDIQQWLGDSAARGAGAVCLPLGRDVDEIRVTPLSGHCGYEGPESAANTPGPGGLLQRGGRGTLAATGCHARIADQRFGGIALRFADGYGFGDSYATGHFYGVYEGFGDQVVGGTDASVFRIADFNAFHYRVEILASGSANWTSPFGDRREHTE